MNLYTVQLSLKKPYQELTSKFAHVSMIVIDIFAHSSEEAHIMALDAIQHQGEFDVDSIEDNGESE